MPDDRAEFRKLAQESLQEAEQSTSEQDKAHWLKVAEAWTKLAMLESVYLPVELQILQPAYRASARAF